MHPSNPLRKNGRMQACSPCRRRKVACDHTRPICNRCVKRKHPEACEYDSNVAPREESSHTEASRRYLSAASIATTPVPQGELNAANHRPGYLGFTSFYRTFNEACTSLPPSQQRAGLFPEEIPTLSPQKSPRISNITLETSLSVIKSIPQRHEAQELFDTHFSPHDGWIRPVAQSTLISLFDTFGQYLTGEATQSRLEDLAHIIFENTANPMSDGEADPQRWLNQFSGVNLRWETLGVLFTYWELGARNDSKRDNSQLDTFRHCIDHCYSLAKTDSDTGNSLLLYLSWKRTVLASLLGGSANLSCWEFHAETVALMTFMGLHAESAQEPYKPSLTSEIRRRLHSLIYINDKLLASFTGRPPLVSRRFHLTPLPLDLTESQLFPDEATLEHAVAHLDQNGWAGRDTFCNSTFLRARTKLALIRDEILEHALGDSTGLRVETLTNLKARAQAVFGEFPPLMALDPESAKDPEAEISIIYMRLIVHLQYLQNLFFIERLLNRYLLIEETELLSLSFDLVSTTLLFWTNMDRLSVLRTDFQWLVMAYAAPGGGILCLELLKPTVSSIDISHKITRSSIIQQLSLLNGFLDWGSSRTPNGGLCAACKTVVQSVLDHVLNAPTSSPGALEAIDWSTFTQLEFDFDLLDTFGWMHSRSPHNLQ